MKRFQKRRRVLGRSTEDRRIYNLFHVVACNLLKVQFHREDIKRTNLGQWFPNIVCRKRNPWAEKSPSRTWRSSSQKVFVWYSGTLALVDIFPLKKKGIYKRNCLVEENVKKRNLLYTELLCWPFVDRLFCAWSPTSVTELNLTFAGGTSRETTHWSGSSRSCDAGAVAVVAEVAFDRSFVCLNRLNKVCYVCHILTLTYINENANMGGSRWHS